ncbi:MAG TPA: DUF362 domain-containing protein [Acidobacteriaceae bacterium]|jgi:uncharacterized protein (DUF362 family)|nr:DUF362 domain-containing protein [Acidobacteriaceae bacterium]
MSLSRRNFVQLAGAGLLAQSGVLRAGAAALRADDSKAATAGVAGTQLTNPAVKVALIHGDERRANVHNALLAIDDQIRPLLRKRKSVVIKPNNVSTTNQLAATHLDAIEGILDYLEERFRGPVTIAEASAGDTLEGFEHFHYNQLATERRSQKVSLVDLNREGKFETVSVLDADLHVAQVRLAARVLDPDAFVISSAMLKTHNTVVATMAVKNMVLGSPLHSAPGELPWNDKRKFHVGIRQTHYNMLVTAERLQPQWGVAVIDGFEGMEGNGPGNGTPVASHVAIASTDFIAADRVGLEVMGINPEWVGYLGYCGQAGVGTYDLAKINVVGAKIGDVARKYQLHPDLERELQWMGPLQIGSPKVGSLEERHLSSVYG